MLRCTERDKSLIVKSGLCRWLTTRQIQRLYFPRATVNAVQKRLRKLTETGYLRTHREDAFSEALHSAGPKGRAIFEKKGLEYVGPTDVPRQIPHLVGINDIRISVETGTLPVAYFFPHWQLSALGWMHPVIPDAVFAVRAPHRRNFAVEFDRATESLSVLVAKICTYANGLPGFPFEAVVIVTESERRMDGLGREIRKRGVSLRVLNCTLSALQENSLLDCSLLELGDGGHRKLLESASPSANLSSRAILA